MPSKQDCDNHRKSTCNGRKQPSTKCNGCAKKIEGRKAPVIVAQIETSIFRGDDIVHFYHPDCWAALPDKAVAVK